MYVHILVVIIVIVYLLKAPLLWLWNIHRIWQVLLPFSPEKTYWFLGIFPVFEGPGEKGIAQSLKWTAANPRYFSSLIPLRPSLVVHHPDIVKQVLKTTEPKGIIPATGTSYGLLTPWIGDGLLNSKGKKWFRNRKLLTPGFHFDVLKPYIRIYNQSADKMIKHFENDCKTHGSVQIYHTVSLCTLDIILKCAFSSQEEIEVNGTESEYAKVVHKLADLIIKRTFSPHYYSDFLYKLSSDGRKFFKLCDFSHNVADNVIKNRREILQAGQPLKLVRNVDFLDILLLAKDEDGSTLTDIEIRDEVETFMFEGHDTTSSAISWALYNLARHPDIQEKVYLEISKLLKDREYVEWEDLNNVPYLTMCIKESMRIHPAIWNVSRELSKPLVIDGHAMPTGTIIDICIFNLHHNPTIWGKDHHLYNPDRFLPENISIMDPFAYVPFSAGPRNCIGQVFAMNEMKVIIGKVLHRFALSLDETHLVERQNDLVLRPKYGIKLKFQKRKNKI